MAEEKHDPAQEYTAQLAGAPPGTLAADPQASSCAIQVISYGETRFDEQRIGEIESLRPLLNDQNVVWIRVEGLGSLNTIKSLGQLFHIHPLALEDVLDTRQRPKIEEYDKLLFFVLRMLQAAPASKTQQLSMFLGENFLLTFQEGPAPCLDVVLERLKRKRGRIRSLGADYLAYCIVDAVVDFFYTEVDSFSEQVDALEERVLGSSSEKTPRKIHQLKRSALSLRRSMSPLREAVNSLIRDGHPEISATTQTHFRDCYDHIIHILEMLEIYRETLSGLLDIHLSTINNRMSEVMRVLTVIATIFIPLTFLAGIYGMNFDHEASPWNMPELHSYWGYPAFLFLMLSVACLQLLFFKRKGWLGRAKEKGQDEKKSS